jgi:hypothetical protein
MHRDISVNNLMVDMRKPWLGVLIDLDLAINLETTGKLPASSLHRTGTLPFMALDLLHDDDKYPQYHRHDLESFVYVLAWIAARYEDGIEVHKTIFNEWCGGGWAAIYRHKHGFLTFSHFCGDFSTTSSYGFLHLPIIRYLASLGEAHTLVLAGLKQKTIARLMAKNPQDKKRDELPNEGYADVPSGSKRRRQHVGVKSNSYPKDLAGVDRDSMLSVLREALEGLGDVPDGTFIMIDKPVD